MCVFTVVMTYSITCPIIVPFGRHRRAGTWALLGGTQDLTCPAPVSRPPRVDRAPAGRPARQASRPVPALVGGLAWSGWRGKCHDIQAGARQYAGHLGSHPNTAISPYTRAFFTHPPRCTYTPRQDSCHLSNRSSSLGEALGLLAGVCPLPLGETPPVEADLGTSPPPLSGEISPFSSIFWAPLSQAGPNPFSSLPDIKGPTWPTLTTSITEAPTTLSRQGHRLSLQVANLH